MGKLNPYTTDSLHKFSCFGYFTFNLKLVNKALVEGEGLHIETAAKILTRNKPRAKYDK